MGPRLGALKAGAATLEHWLKINLGESFQKSHPIHQSEASLSFELGKIQRIIFIYFYGQIGDKSYRTVEHLERRATGKENNDAREDGRGRSGDY